MRLGSHQSEEAKAKMSSSLKGRVITQEWRNNLSAAGKGRAVSAETRAKLSAIGMGHVVSAETRAKLSASNKGQVSHNKGVPMSEAAKAKLSVSCLGRTISPEAREKISAAMKGRYVSPETRAKMSVVNSNRSPETRAKLSAASMGNKYGLGHHPSEEAKAKTVAAHWKGGEKIAQIRHAAKRRTLGFVPLNQPIDGYEAHHVDKEHVIFMPKELHHSIYHNQWTGQNMDKINALAYEWLAKERDAL